MTEKAKSGFVSLEEQGELDGLLNELLDLDEGLSPWEVDFIDDMNRWREMKYFAGGQPEKIRQIHEERVVKGVQHGQTD